MLCVVKVQLDKVAPLAGMDMGQTDKEHHHHHWWVVEDTVAE